MNKTNGIVVCRDNYESTKEFEEAVKTIVMWLLNAGYVMTVRYDEKGLGIVSIEYDYDDESLGGMYPCWLTSDQREDMFF